METIKETVGDIETQMLAIVPNPAEYRKYRESFDRASDFVECPEAPIHLDIELNNTCNYTCSFCVYGNDKYPYYQTKNSLPKEKAFAILDQAAQMGVKSVQFNIINEPLLNRDLFDVVAYGNKLKFQDMFLITNGSALTKDASMKLMASGLTKLMISIDAFSEETYFKVRQNKNYHKVVKNITDFIELRKQLGFKLPVVRVSFLVNEFNRHEVEVFRAFWSSRADFVVFQNLIDFDHPKQDLKTRVDKKIRCSMSNFRMAIKADGSVNPCCTVYGDKLKMGNIHESSLSDLWNTKRWKGFTKMHKDYGWHKNPVCRECILNTEFNEDSQILK